MTGRKQRSVRDCLIPKKKVTSTEKDCGSKCSSPTIRAIFFMFTSEHSQAKDKWKSEKV